MCIGCFEISINVIVKNVQGIRIFACLGGLVKISSAWGYRRIAELWFDRGISSQADTVQSVKHFNIKDFTIINFQDFFHNFINTRSVESLWKTPFETFWKKHKGTCPIKNCRKIFRRKNDKESTNEANFHKNTNPDWESYKKEHTKHSKWLLSFLITRKPGTFNSTQGDHILTCFDSIQSAPSKNTCLIFFQQWSFQIYVLVFKVKQCTQEPYPSDIQLFKVSNGNIRKTYKLCSELTTNTSERHWCCPGAYHC